jgi:osmoprotectant transport system permease protein
MALFSILSTQWAATGNYLLMSTTSVQLPLYRQVFNYINRRSDLVLDLFKEHLWLVLLSVGIAIVISVTLGIIISYYSGLATTVLTVCQIIMTIPSMAMLGFMVPVFGIGFTTGVVALILYCLLPIVRNTYTGIKEISPAVIESAKAMGMTEWRILTRVKIPLARPVIMAGIRTATVMVVGIGAIAAYVGAGGLGELIFHGISRSGSPASAPMIIVGALGVSIIALAFDFMLFWGEKRFASVGKIEGVKG